MNPSNSTPVNNKPRTNIIRKITPVIGIIINTLFYFVSKTNLNYFDNFDEQLLPIYIVGLVIYSLSRLLFELSISNELI